MPEKLMYRNDGLPWRRAPAASAQVVPHGGLVEVTPREHVHIQSDPELRVRLIWLREDTQEPKPLGAEGDAGTDGQPNTPEWPLKISPRLYLSRYPKGRHADLAKQLLTEEVAA